MNGAAQGMIQCSLVAPTGEVVEVMMQMPNGSPPLRLVLLDSASNEKKTYRIGHVQCVDGAPVKAYYYVMVSSE